MASWSAQDAEVRFSELLETCLKDGPQIVTQRGAESAVLVSMEEWERLRRAARPTLKDLLLTDEARCDFDLPERSRMRQRPPPVLD